MRRYCSSIRNALSIIAAINFRETAQVVGWDLRAEIETFCRVAAFMRNSSDGLQLRLETVEPTPLRFLLQRGVTPSFSLGRAAEHLRRMRFRVRSHL